MPYKVYVDTRQMIVSGKNKVFIKSMAEVLVSNFTSCPGVGKAVPQAGYGGRNFKLPQKPRDRQ